MRWWLGEMASLVRLVILVSGMVTGLNRIVFKGSKMFDSVTGEQFFLRGVAYQPRAGGNSDALADAAACHRDAPILKELGANAIRVYEAYPGQNHDACMEAFKREGIYLMLDLPIPNKSVNREGPRYSLDILNHYKANVDTFQKYSNLIGFIAGNEVTNNLQTTEASAHIKAVIRDTKAYIAQRGWRIPVGYVDNDDPAIRRNIQDYFNCGPDSERADFYGINIYSWCGQSSFEQSGYSQRTRELADYSTPVFLGEYGCNVAATRPFNEIQSIYGPDMQSVFSGGFIYEYSYEQNRYGLVRIDSSNSVTKLNDYYTVKHQFEIVNPQKTNLQDYNPTNLPRQCPQVSDAWKSHPNLPPTPSSNLCQCAYDSLSCRVNHAGTLPENGYRVGEQLGYICQYGICTDVASDPKSGTYGRFSTCPITIANSIIFDAAFRTGSPCDFNGFGERASPNGDINWCH